MVKKKKATNYALRCAVVAAAFDDARARPMEMCKCEQEKRPKITPKLLNGGRAKNKNKKKKMYTQTLSQLRLFVSLLVFLPFFFSVSFLRAYSVVQDGMMPNKRQRRRKTNVWWTDFEFFKCFWDQISGYANTIFRMASTPNRWMWCDGDQNETNRKERVAATVSSKLSTGSWEI